MLKRSALCALIFIILTIQPYPPIRGYAENKIQEMIDSANPGDTVFIKSGNYMECIVISKPIHLVGESPVDTIINCCGDSDVITVLSDNVIIASITVKNSSGNSGIYIKGASNVSLVNCVLSDCYFGVKIDFSSNVFISNCTISNNTFAGIRVWGTSVGVNIQNSTVFNNRYGIGLFTYSQGNVINANSVFSNFIGVAMLNSKENQIIKNFLFNNSYGLYLEDRLTTNNTIAKNQITNNTYGVYINLFVNGQTGNLFYLNNFLNNTRHAFVEPLFSSLNNWNLSYPIGGNYWGNYNFEDLMHGVYQNLTGSDGLIDKPYFIAENNIDFYPLVNPYIESIEEHNKKENFEFIPLIIAITIFVVVYTINYTLIKRSTQKQRNDIKKLSLQLFVVHSNLAASLLSRKTATRVLFLSLFYVIYIGHHSTNNYYLSDP